MAEVVRRGNRGTRYGNGAGHGGPRKGEGKGPASGVPAREYKWEDAQPGNELGKTHGASMEKYYAPVAQVITTDLLEDSACPDYLRSPVMLWPTRSNRPSFLMSMWIMSPGLSRS